MTSLHLLGPKGGQTLLSQQGNRSDYITRANKSKQDYKSNQLAEMNAFKPDTMSDVEGKQSDKEYGTMYTIQETRL